MAENNKFSKSGRKPLVNNEIDLIFRKLEPYLKKGLSLHKACLEAQIPKSTAKVRIYRSVIKGVFSTEQLRIRLWLPISLINHLIGS